MKKIIKNILLSFVIIFTILNLVFYTATNIIKYYRINNILNEYVGENNNVLASIEAEANAKEFIEHMKYNYGEDAPVTQLAMLNNYIMGMNVIIEGQTILLIATLILSISIGIILSLTEKSKVKELLNFIIAGVIFILAGATINYISGEYKEFKIFETIKSIGIYYIVIYLMKIVFKYLKNKKNVKELNKELKNKNK